MAQVEPVVIGALVGNLYVVESCSVGGQVFLGGLLFVFEECGALRSNGRLRLFDPCLKPVFVFPLPHSKSI